MISEIWWFLSIAKSSLFSDIKIIISHVKKKLIYDITNSYVWYLKIYYLISGNVFFSKVKKWTFPKHKHVLFSNAHHFQIPGTYAIFKHIFDPFYIKKKWFSDLNFFISDSYFWFFYMKKQNFCYEKIPFKDL